MNLALKRTPGIYLVGFMGSGKTTVGRMLSRRLGWRFVDVDSVIEGVAGMAVPDIFDTRGEEEFRRLESEAIAGTARDISQGKPTVVAVGGGAFSWPGNAALMAERGVTIWLDVTFEVARDRCRQTTHRPLARDPVKFEQLYHARRESYGRADYRVPVEVNDSALVVEAILKLPLFE